MYWFLLYYYFLVNQPVHSALYTSRQDGRNIIIEPRDTYYVTNDTMDGLGEQTNVQNLTYVFIIKLHSPNATSYCPLVSIIQQ